MPKVLVCDPLSEEGLAVLRGAAGIDVEVRTGMTPEELRAAVADADALAVRSETKVTEDVIAAGRRLRIIGRAGVGVDNIDVPAATRQGVVVVNSPDGNTIAAAELTVALILNLCRHVGDAQASLRAGKWERKKFTGVELLGKTVGIVGLGRIGYAVAERLKGFKVSLIAYNPFATEEATREAGVEPVSLDQLIERADILTVHTPLNDETRGMIGPDQFARMKRGIRIINCARGGVIDEAALAAAAADGTVAGFATDVFTSEPPPEANPLLSAPNALLTPHLGASTVEAQVKVAVDVAEQIVDVLNGLPPRSPVNVPALSPEQVAAAEPWLALAERLGSLAMQLAGGDPLTAVEITFAGSFANLPTKTITRAMLRGLLSPVSGEAVNMVNATALAESSGIRVVEKHRAEADPEVEPSIIVQAHQCSRDREVCGTVRDGGGRIVRLDGYHVDLAHAGAMIITHHADRPGIVGRVGTVLGDAGINIAGMNVGRDSGDDQAVMALLLDTPAPAAVVDQIRAIPGLGNAIQVTV